MPRFVSFSIVLPRGRVSSLEEILKKPYTVMTANRLDTLSPQKEGEFEMLLAKVG